MKKSQPMTDVSSVVTNFTLEKLRRRIASYGLFSSLPVHEKLDNRWEEMEKDIKLYRWVLDRALLDILGGGTEQQRQESLDWVFPSKDEDEDFLFICEMAQLSPELVKKYTLKLKQAYEV